MNNCKKCGASLMKDAEFCHQCGAKVAEVEVTVEHTLPIQHNVACALTYAFGALTGLLFLLIEPYNKDRDIRFHAWQSIGMCGALFLINISFGIMALGLFFIWFLQPILNLGFLVLWIVMLIKAYNGERYKLPVIGDFAETQSKKSID